MFLREAMAKYLRETPNASLEEFVHAVEAQPSGYAVWRGAEATLAQQSLEREQFEAVRAELQREVDEAVSAVLAGPAFGLEPEALHTRNSDALDFHDVAIWRLREAVAEAYRLGFAAGCADETPAGRAIGDAYREAKRQ